MDEVASNSDGKRQSAALSFRMQKYLAVWLFKVEKWDGVKKNCIVFIKTNVKTDDVCAVGLFGREFPGAESQNWGS